MTFEVGKLLQETAEEVFDWLADVGIELAIGKSELLIPTRKRTHNTLEVNNKGHVIKSQPSIRYLEVRIHSKVSFKAHAADVVKKANDATRSLGGIMPNTRVPTHTKRKLLATVPYSIFLYGAPIWGRTMAPSEWKTMAQCHRQITLRVALAYRTILGEALLVLAGTPPIDLMVTESADIHEGRQQNKNQRLKKKKKLKERWQARWEIYEKGEWTRLLIPDIVPWISRSHGNITFHLTQALSGHGCFAAYLHWFGLLSTAECWYCGHPSDDARHTLFRFDAWETRRVDLESKVGSITPENLVCKMLANRQTWDECTSYITGVIKEKEAEE